MVLSGNYASSLFRDEAFTILWFSRILDSAMDAIITIDENQNIVLFNTAAQTMFGYSKEEVMGAAFALLIPLRFRNIYKDHVNGVGGADAASMLWGQLNTLTGLRKNQTEFPLEASISHIQEHGKTFYTVILRDVTERVKAEQALHESKEELRRLTAVTNSIKEQEKSRIARELHDELGQALTALRMDVNWIHNKLANEHALLSEKLHHMEELLNGTVAATRRIASDLRPLILDDLGLKPAAEWLIQNFIQRTGVPCRGWVSGLDDPLHDPYATAIFRILQESLTNIAKHAQASEVQVKINKTLSHIHIEVSDNGKGFSLHEPHKPHTYGLIGVYERAYLLGGTALVKSEPGKGTRITASIPIQERPHP